MKIPASFPLIAVERLKLFVLSCGIIAAAVGCRRTPQVPAPTPRQPRTGQRPPQRGNGKLDNGLYDANAPIRPSSQMTPGAVLEVTPQDFCTPGYSKKVRNVPSSVKRKVYESYGITRRSKGEYEVDHLISLQLGGSNSIKNLWPQSYKTHPWNAGVKDKLENELHRRICSEGMDAATAQHEISTDWIAAYKKYMKDDPSAAGYQANTVDEANAVDETDTDDLDSNPATNGVENTAVAGGAGDSKVWVNLNSGKYFEAGDRYYGKTKSGEYITEAQALQRGYHKAGG